MVTALTAAADRWHQHQSFCEIDDRLADDLLSCSVSADHWGAVPTISSVDQWSAALTGVATAHDQEAADQVLKSKPSAGVSRGWAAQQAAHHFVRWAIEHSLAREWTVDEIWFLASQDFALALGVSLPPRRNFFGALQRQPGVAVTYDRRVRDRQGRIKYKTTFYRLPTDIAVVGHVISEIEQPGQISDQCVPAPRRSIGKMQVKGA